MSSCLSVVPFSYDNYSYILESDEGLLVIDPGEADPVLAIAESRKKPVELILNTHHHADHTKGNSVICEKYKSKVAGICPDLNPFVGHELKNDEVFSFYDFSIQTIYTPGHTRSSICFLISDRDGKRTLFSGDTLFLMGCGRLFENDYEGMYKSLMRIRDLPKDTLIYPGHEYTMENIDFALYKKIQYEKEHIIKQYSKEDADEGMTVPGTIGLELKYNPFLNCENEDYWQNFSCFGNKKGLEVFKILRKEKNSF